MPKTIIYCPPHSTFTFLSRLLIMIVIVIIIIIIIVYVVFQCTYMYVYLWRPEEFPGGVDSGN